MMEHSHKKTRRHLSFSTKILTINLLIIVCIFAVTGFLIYHNLYDHLFENEKLLAVETFSKVSDFVTQKQDMVFSQYTAIHKHDNIADYFQEMQRGHLSPFDVDTIQFIDNYFSSIFTAEADISDFILIGPDGTVYSKSRSATRYVSPSYDFDSYFLLEELKESDRNFIVDYDDQLSYLSSAGIPAISYAGKIFDIDAFPRKQVVGYFIINFPVSCVQETFQEYFNGTNSELFYINNNNRILFSTSESKMGEIYQFPDDPAIFTQNKYIDISGSQVVMQLDSRIPLQSISGIRDYFFIMLAIAIVAVSVFTFNLHRAMQQKLDSLARSMRHVQNGDLSQRLPVTGTDEISQLSEQFNEMCNRLQRFISLNYIAETQKRMAQINALQAQINPHFLYNTIDGIRDKVLSSNGSNQEDIAEMLVMLARLFRYSADISENIVYLEDEIAYVESYLEMQHIRFGDAFHYDIQVDDGLYYMGIPKLILQPLIENAIVHGLCGREGGFVQIRVTAGNSNLILAIEDNGCGMPPEQVQQLNQYMQSEALDTDMRFGIGIKNVHDRIHLLFSGTSGIAVTSSQNVGTRIIISLPAMTKEKMQECIKS